MKREKLRIESDGTGMGTNLIVGDTQIDGVKSLRFEISGRSGVARVTMEIEAGLWLDAEVVRHGELPVKDLDDDDEGCDAQ